MVHNSSGNHSNAKHENNKGYCKAKCEDWKYQTTMNEHQNKQVYALMIIENPSKSWIFMNLNVIEFLKKRKNLSQINVKLRLAVLQTFLHLHRTEPLQVGLVCMAWDVVLQEVLDALGMGSTKVPDFSFWLAASRTNSALIWKLFVECSCW